MCHIIITKSIHCDDVAHHNSRYVACPKFWGEPYHRAGRCKNRRELHEEYAGDCPNCGWVEVDEFIPVTGPWGSTATAIPEPLDATESPEAEETSDSNSGSSPEGWFWSDAEEDEHSDGLVDEDTDITLEEYFDEPPKQQTSEDIPLIPISVA